MTQPVLPEVQAIVDGLRKQINLARAEIAPMEQLVQEKRLLIEEWRDVIETLIPGSEPDPFGLRKIRQALRPAGRPKGQSENDKPHHETLAKEKVA